MRLSALVLLALCSFVGTVPTADAQVQFRAGPLVYTPGVDFTLGPSLSGAGYYIEQAYIASPPQPTVGQHFYVNVVMQGIVNQPVGRLMAIYFVPPQGASVVASSSDPVRCYYKNNSNYVEFTNQPVIDQGVGGGLRIFGCKQPAAGGTPYPIVNIPGFGTAYELARNDPQNASPFFPMPYQAGYVFAIPLVANRTMDGFSSNNRFIAAIRSIQGDSGDPWAFPQLALLVSPGAAPASADLRGSITSAAGAPVGFNRVIGRCTNFGPDAAQSVSCGFGALPAGASNSCSPASPQATLGLNQFIECTTDFPFQPGGVTITFNGASATADPLPNNNGVGLTMQPGTGTVDPIHANGFE